MTESMTGALHVASEMAAIKHELAGRPDPRYMENILTVMHHLLQNWQVELAWVRSIRDAISDPDKRNVPPA